MREPLASARAVLVEATEAAWARDRRLGEALGRLSGQATVALSDATPTASIRAVPGGGYRIELGRRFLAEQVRDGDDLLFLLLHELYHELQGDLLRELERAATPTGRWVANLVADVQINGALCRRYFPGGVGLLERCYGALEFPGLLLLPPQLLLRRFGAALGAPGLRGVRTIEEAAALPRDELEEAVERALARARAPARHRPALARWYCEAWLDPATRQGLFERLRPLLSAPGEVLLLGDHTRPRGRRRRGPGPDDALAGAGWNEHEEEDAIRVAERPQGRRALYAALAAALAPCHLEPRDATAFLPDRGVVPSPGRREAFLLAARLWPVFFPLPALGEPDEEQRAHVYVDVSGSTDEVQPAIYGLLRHLGHLIAPPAHLFSNRVADVSLSELARGVRRSTGGTDFDCVLLHAVRSGYRRILIVTDGYAAYEETTAAAVQRAGLEIYVALTVSLADTPLEQLARKVWTIPDDGW